MFKKISEFFFPKVEKKIEQKFIDDYDTLSIYLLWFINRVKNGGKIKQVNMFNLMDEKIEVISQSKCIKPEFDKHAKIYLTKKGVRLSSIDPNYGWGPWGHYFGHNKIFCADGVSQTDDLPVLYWDVYKELRRVGFVFHNDMFLNKTILNDLKKFYY